MEVDKKGLQINTGAIKHRAWHLPEAVVIFPPVWEYDDGVMMEKGLPSLYC